MAFILDENLYEPGDYTVQYIGFRLPFSFGSPDESLNDDTIDNIKDNLKGLLLTEPGDRLFHPMLGVNFRKFLFEQMPSDIEKFQIEVQEDIEAQIRRWMPFLVVKAVRVIPQPDNNTIRVEVDFNFAKNSKLYSSVSVDVSVGG